MCYFDCFFFIFFKLNCCSYLYFSPFAHILLFLTLLCSTAPFLQGWWTWPASKIINTSRWKFSLYPWSFLAGSYILYWYLHHGKGVRLCDLLRDTQSRERSGAHCCQGHTFNSKYNQVLMKSTHILDQFTSGMLSLSACYCKTFLLFIRLIENPIAVSTYIQMSTLPPFLIKLMEYMNYFKVDFPSIFSQIWIEIPILIKW